MDDLTPGNMILPLKGGSLSHGSTVNHTGILSLFKDPGLGLYNFSWKLYIICKYKNSRIYLHSATKGPGWRYPGQLARETDGSLKR